MRILEFLLSIITENMTQVLVRLHPSSSDSCIEVHSNSKLRIHSELNCEQLSFDSVGDGFYSQEDIFEEIGAPIATSLKNGQNSLVVALGQKNSGKSYSLFGSDCQAKGLIEMVVHDLKIRGFELAISCYQIFNQQIIDLLSPVPRARQLKYTNNQYTIAQLIEYKLLPLHNVQCLLQSALRNRKSTSLNSQNSLSSSVIIVTLNTRRLNSSMHGKVEFVELSGYENVYSNGSRRELSGMHNKSTNSFIKMISGLNKTSDFEYQSSKLTQIVKNSLGEKSNRYVIAHVRAEKRFLNETLFTLDLAIKAKNLGKSKLKIDGFTSTSRYNKCEENNSTLINTDSRRDTLVKCPPIESSPMNIIINNEKHLKNLIQLYEDRIYQIEKAEGRQVQAEKKILQRVAHQYAALLRNFPTFSQILAQNINLKQQTSERTIICSPFAKKKLQASFTNPAGSLEMISHSELPSAEQSQLIHRQHKMLQEYEKLICLFKQQFMQKLSQLSKHYSQLQAKHNSQQQLKLHYASASIKDFIIEDDELENLRSEVQILRSENVQLRLKNNELKEQVSKEGLTYQQLRLVRQRCQQIQNCMLRDEEIRNQYAKEIQQLKKQLAEKQSNELQESITIKKSKTDDKSISKVNDTEDTFLFDDNNPQLLREIDILNKSKLEVSRLLGHKAVDRENLKQYQNISLPLQPKILSKANPPRYSDMIKPQFKRQKKEKSQLQRLRLVLLKQKEKTNRTKFNYLAASQKQSLVTSKSSMFQRQQYSHFSQRCNSRPEMHFTLPDEPSYKLKKQFISYRPNIPTVQSEY